MATLGKIRKHGWLLLVVTGLALLAFIVGDGIKAIRPSQNIRNVGEVNGEKISAQDYQDLVEEYEEVLKFVRNSNSLNENEIAQVKDEVWNQLVSTKLVENEVGKLGLTVTPAELQAVIEEGTDPMLTQSFFVNPQTGQFDKDQLYKFLADYKDMDMETMPAQYVEYYHSVYNYWKFIEKNLTQQILMEKYEALVSAAQLGNPAAAQYAFDGRNNYCKLAYAVIPFSSIADSTVTVTDADLKAVYNSRKEAYKQPGETRDIKYIDITVVPSEADRTALQAEVAEAAQQLENATNEELASIVRLNESTITYSEVARTEAGLPEDVFAKLAEMTAGQVVTYFNEDDDTYNAVKFIGTVTAPDSIQYQQVSVALEDAARTKELGDSIYNAIIAGGDMIEIAQKYDQNAEPQWLASASYQAAAISGDNAAYINALSQMKKGEVKQLSLGGAELILKVVDTTAPITKYQTAVVKRPAFFSKETYSKAYNNLSQFVASNPTLADIEANAEEEGFRLLPLSDLQNNAHTIGGVASTREALRWAFGAKVGEVSQIFEAGQNDHLMVLAVEGIHKAGYRSVADMADLLKYEATNDKKAEQIMAQVKGVKTLADVAAMEGAKTDTLARVSFSAPAFVSKVPASEPVISGKAAGLEPGTVAGPIKGNGGIYFIEVIEQSTGAQNFDAEQEQKTIAATAARNINASRMINELFMKGKVVDNRYLFF